MANKEDVRDNRASAMQEEMLLQATQIQRLQPHFPPLLSLSLNAHPNTQNSELLDVLGGVIVGAGLYRILNLVRRGASCSQYDIDFLEAFANLNERMVLK